MRVLHVAATYRRASGILQQMEWEHRAAESLGLDWETRLYAPAGNYRDSPVIVTRAQRRRNHQRFFQWVLFRASFFRWLRKFGKEFDLVLLRYSPRDFIQLLYLLSRGRRVTYLVHHTLELPELQSSQARFKTVSVAIERIVGPLCLALARGSICVTKEIQNYETRRSLRPRRTLLYPNGVFAEQDPVADLRSDTIELLFVSSEFETWQGLDLLLKSANGDKSDFLVHLVGKLSAADRKSVVNDPRFVIHDTLNSEEIARLASHCWVGISSLALQRKGMDEACPLKVREYLSMGLPCVGSYSDVFPQDFPFFKALDPRVDLILEVARGWRKFSRSEVVDSALPYIDKSKLLSALYDELLRP